MVVRVVLVAVFLACFALLAVPVQADPTTDPAQPVAALAQITSAGVIVSWVPGAQPVDSFEVYGVADGVLSPLASAQSDQMSAPVPTNAPRFSEYAVTAWHDGTQTQATVALLSVTDPCVAIYSINPPAVAVSNCLEGWPAPVVWAGQTRLPPGLAGGLLS